MLVGVLLFVGSDQHPDNQLTTCHWPVISQPTANRMNAATASGNQPPTHHGSTCHSQHTQQTQQPITIIKPHKHTASSQPNVAHKQTTTEHTTTQQTPTQNNPTTNTRQRQHTINPRPRCKQLTHNHHQQTHTHTHSVCVCAVHAHCVVCVRVECTWCGCGAMQGVPAHVQTPQ